jgi:hypothetical protein
MSFFRDISPRFLNSGNLNYLKMEADGYHFNWFQLRNL